MPSFFKGVIAGAGLTAAALMKGESELMAIGGPVAIGGAHDLLRAWRRGPAFEEEHVSQMTKGLITGMAIVIFLKNAVESYSGNTNSAIKMACLLTVMAGYLGAQYQIYNSMRLRA